MWVDKGSEFYYKSFKKRLNDNDIEMYPIHNEGKSVVAERFIIKLKTKIYKYMTSVSKNKYIDKLDDIAGEYNNTYHRIIKMKRGNVKDNTYIDFKKMLMIKILNLRLVMMIKIRILLVAVPLYKKEPICSKTLVTIWWRY